MDFKDFYLSHYFHRLFSLSTRYHRVASKCFVTQQVIGLSTVRLLLRQLRQENKKNVDTKDSTQPQRVLRSFVCFFFLSCVKYVGKKGSHFFECVLTNNNRFFIMIIRCTIALTKKPKEIM